MLTFKFLNKRPYGMIDIPAILTAKELLDFFNPSNEIWCDPWSTQKYLFRAQYEADTIGYPLIPSVFRSIQQVPYLQAKFNEAKLFLERHGTRPEINRFGGLYDTPVFKNSVILKATEKFILKEFVERTNKIGMHVPESDKILNWDPSINELISEPELADILPNENAKKQGKKLSLDVLKKLRESGFKRPPLFSGLAQHHGCPTRLLDFSFNPFKALFHTINKETTPPNGYISLYVVPENMFDQHRIEDQILMRTPPNTDMIYQLIRMPSSNNHYLFQQEGLFAYPVMPYDHLLRTDIYPSVNSFAKMMSFHNSSSNQLRKVSIPVSEFKELRKLLKRFNITLSSMMPNLDNIVKEMKDDANNI